MLSRIHLLVTLRKCSEGNVKCPLRNQMLLIYIKVSLSWALTRFNLLQTSGYTAVRYVFSFQGKDNQTPLTWYNVTKGETVRFRVIGSGSLYPLRVSVDSHPITIIASDGHDVAHTAVESFIINPGERFDFLLTANQSVHNYWIRANSIEVSRNFS